MDALAGRLEHRGHGVLRQPVDLELRPARAQLADDREVALGVAEADGAGDVERPRPLAAARRTARRRRSEELLEQEVHAHGIARLGGVPGAGEPHQASAHGLREEPPALHRDDRVVLAVDHEHRVVDAAAELEELVAVPDPRGVLGRDQGLRVGLEAPADAVLDLLRRVRLGEDPGHEELEEAEVVGAPVVLVELRPARGRVEAVAECGRGVLGDRDGGADERRARHAVGVPVRDQERAVRAAGDRDEAGLVGSGRVQDGERVVGVVLLRVRLGARGPVGLPVPARVEGQDPEAAREPGELRLPQPRVDERPGREEEDRGVAVAPALPVHADALALDEALFVGREDRPLLARAYGRASNTMLNGVSAARRKRVIPPAVTTSRMRASPAWAPSASPTSCDSEAGVQRSVENP